MGWKCATFSENFITDLAERHHASGGWKSMGMEMSKPTSLEFLQAVYLNESLPLNTRLRAAIEAAPYEHAKLTAVAVGYMNESFGVQLDRAIARSKGPLLIESNAVVEVHPASELKGNFARLRRRV